MSAMMNAMAMSPRGWWRRHPLPDGVAAPVADSHLAFGGLIAFTFILLLAPQMMVPALAVLSFIRPALFAASVAAVSYLCNRMLTGRPLTVFTRELWLGAALLAWASITVPVSYWPGGSVAVIAGVFVKSLLVFWLIANVVNTPERLRRFMIVLSLAGAPLALTAILNYRAGVFMEGATAVKRITGYDAPLTQNPNDLALMLNLLAAPCDRAPPDAAAAAPAHAAPHDHRARGGRHHPHVLARGLPRDGRHHGGLAVEVPAAARAGMGARHPRARHRVPAAPAVRLYAAARHHGQCEGGPHRVGPGALAGHGGGDRLRAREPPDRRGNRAGHPRPQRGARPAAGARSTTSICSTRWTSGSPARSSSSCCSGSA